LIKNKIPVMGHLGVLPQSATNFRFKGKETSERKIILRDSKLLEEAGVFSMVLECVESSLAKEITKTIKVPTIGIGASIHCDGQVLVTDDLIGLSKIKARFIKRYLNMEKQINNAVLKYKLEVSQKKFPAKKHSY
jgi:3-methyl-2-oxobutanoate hydroxymethyltransferase